jgi:predicted metal-dependent enzyme (double-stranded beta helix superfamily)
MERSAPSYARAESEAARLLETVAAGTDRLVTRARALPRPPGGRAWARVADQGGADAWLIVWSPGSATGRHDHGDSCGLVRVLRGTLVERAWPEGGGGAHIRRIGRGGTLSVPRDRSHDVANAGHRVAISLHVYAPRLSRMNFYTEHVPAPVAVTV